MEAKHLPVLFASDTRAERQRESADGREGVLGGVAVPSLSPSGALSDEDAAVKAAAIKRPRRMKRKPILRRATPASYFPTLDRRVAHVGGVARRPQVRLGLLQ